MEEYIEDRFVTLCGQWCISPGVAVGLLHDDLFQQFAKDYVKELQKLLEEQ